MERKAYFLDLVDFFGFSSSWSSALRFSACRELFLVPSRGCGFSFCSFLGACRGQLSQHLAQKWSLTLGFFSLAFPACF